MCRIAVILKSLDTAYKELADVDFITNLRLTEKFEEYCLRLIQRYNNDKFTLSSNIFLKAKPLAEYFFKNHLSLAGYSFNPDKNLAQIITQF